VAAITIQDQCAAGEAPGTLFFPELKTVAATQRVGRWLGAVLQPGDVLGLDGPLGAGKTSLVQGLARGLGVPRQVAVGSPTFTLVNQYGGQPGAAAGPLTLYHVDLYRLKNAQELDELGLWEAAESGGVIAVEWLSRFPQALPADRLELTLALLPQGGRSLHLRARGPRSAARLTALPAALPRAATPRRRSP
jgi:tRNA threonylcarbamoyladenosine biosynthesis protein TsaE